MSERFDNCGDDVEKLRANLVNLTPKNVEFCNKLIAWWDAKKWLSEGQLKWVRIYADRKDDLVKLQDEAEEGIKIKTAMTKLNSMFDEASNHLKYPGVTVQLPEVGQVLIATPYYGRKPDGEIEVSTRRGSTGKWIYRGSVIDDRFYPANKNFATPQAILDLINEVAEDPINTAIKYGKLTGCCCFCNSGLEDERSVSMGYGPVCAKNWGLPWGK